MRIKIHLRTLSNSHSGNTVFLLILLSLVFLLVSSVGDILKCSLGSGRRVYSIISCTEQSISPHDTVTVNSVEVSDIPNHCKIQFYISVPYIFTVQCKYPGMPVRQGDGCTHSRKMLLLERPENIPGRCNREVVAVRVQVWATPARATTQTFV